jgi:hypothetical protein
MRDELAFSTLFSVRYTMISVLLNAEQELEAQRVAKILQEKLAGDVLQLTRLLVSKKDSEIFGKTEFEVRDRVHEMGAKALQTVLDERKKGGTKDQA